MVCVVNSVAFDVGVVVVVVMVVVVVVQADSSERMQINIAGIKV